MFLKNSRYHGLPTETVTDRQGREVTIVKLRRLPATAGDDTTVSNHDRLDLVAHARYRDATRFWHVADASSALEAETLTQVAGAVIRVPPR